jgi:hypothetical protein
MLKRHEVEVLLKAGHRKTEVAHMSGVSLRSARCIAQEEAVVHVDDEAERGKRQIGRPSTAQNFRKQAVGILLETPDLPSLEILRRVREAGYQGARRRSTIWWPRFAPSQPSRWCVSKGFLESSVSTISGK